MEVIGQFKARETIHCEYLRTKSSTQNALEQNKRFSFSGLDEDFCWETKFSLC